MLKKLLNNAGVILYPTDTVWGIGCDATNKVAVSKIFTIKKREESKSLVILVDGLDMLKKYIENIPDEVTEILSISDRPTTVVYSNPVGLAENVLAADNTVAIRIVKHAFCQNLIAHFGKPLVSSSANISGQPTPSSFQEIDKSILKAVDYIVDLPEESFNNKPSRIIRFVNNKLEVIRE